MPRLLMIGYVWPEPKASAAGVRDEALLEIFREAGHAVTFASTARPNEAKLALEARGFATWPIAANDPAFDLGLAELRPDLVIFDRFVHEEQFGWRVRGVCPEALRVLDTQDLHFLRKARGEWTGEGLPLNEIVARVPSADGDELLRELAAIYRSDLTLLCSDFERDLLVREYGVPAELLALASFFYPEPQADLPDFASRNGFVSVGNFRHAPNLDALFWLKREIWPLIRAGLPDARVDVYGAYPSREVMALHAPAEGFAVRGPEAGEIGRCLERYRVNLAPLRFGAGIKGKIAEGWRVGTPAVTTPIGAEGMCASVTSEGASPNFGGDFGGVVALDAKALAQEAIALHRDEAAWGEASARGRALIRSRFSQAANARALLAAVERARGKPRNVVGRMLWHQSLRATEYFSRWIEEKNRRQKT